MTIFNGFEQHILLDQKPFIPKIYEGGKEPVEPFNTQLIRLDASDRSLLNWQNEIAMTQKAIQKGFKIFWELDFGLSGSLDDETRFLSLQLNIHHFNDTIWSPFQENSCGVALYRGKLEISKHEILLNYLKSLAAQFPTTVKPFIFLEIPTDLDLEHYFRLMASGDFGFLTPIVKGSFAETYPLALASLAWGHGASPLGFCSAKLENVLPQTRVSHAICFPKEGKWEQIHKAIQFLDPLPFRMIPESLLTQEWDGIDQLIIFSDAHPEQVKRSIRGFVAAGGMVLDFSKRTNI